MATAHTHQDFKLVIPDEVVESLPGDDVTLGCHLSPSTSAVAMEIRWFKRTNCIYWYANGHVTVGGGYEDRVSVSPQQLQRGDVSLTLRGVGEEDGRVYTCQVISGEHTQEGRVGLASSDRLGLRPSSDRLGLRASASLTRLRAAASAASLLAAALDEEITAEERKRMEESVQSLVVQSWRKASEELMQKIKEAEENKKTLEEAQQQLKMRDSEIERRDRLLQDRDKQIETTDKLLEKKDLQIKEGEQNLKEKMALLEESKERLMEVEKLMDRNKELEKSKEQLEEKSKEVHEIHQLLEERNTLLQERETALEEMSERERERETALEKMSEREREREGLLENMSSEVETSKSQLESLGKELQDRNSQLQELRTQLLQKERELEERDRQMEERDREMEERDRQLEERDRQLEERDRQFEERDREMEERDRQLEERDRQQDDRDRQMEERDRQLEERDRQMDERGRDMEERERQLKERGRQMEERGRQMEERGRQRDERDRQMEERDRQMEIKEGSGDDADSPYRRTRRWSKEHPPDMGGESPGPAPPVSPAVCELRLVLLGGSAAGKRAAGNTILGTEEFGRQASTHTLTHTSTESQHSESRQGEVAGRRVAVVETPDWFCSGLSEKDTRQDVGLCVRLSAPGPHAFLLVLPAEPSEGEERRMLEKMEDIFGEGCWRHTLILFTHAEGLGQRSVEELLQTGSQELQQLVEKCGNRCHLLHIKDRPDDTEITQLLEKIEEMVSGNRETFYSSETYQEAERQLREIERRMQRQREEMRERKEREVKSKHEKEMENCVHKMETEMKERDEKILVLQKRIRELERELESERNMERKRELERELEEEKSKNRGMQMEKERLEQDFEKDKMEMEEKHREEMEEMRESYEREIRAEAEINLMKIILPQLQRNISIFKAKVEKVYNKQLEETRLMLKELQDRNSQLLQELRSQLLEKERELEERERQLEERERQMKERDRQLEERERQLEEGNKQLTEREKREMERREGDDPGPPPIRRRQSCPFLPPTMGAESRGPGVLRVRVQSMLEGVPAFIRRNSSGWLLHYITSNI